MGCPWEMGGQGRPGGGGPGSRSLPRTARSSQQRGRAWRLWWPASRPPPRPRLCPLFAAPLSRSSTATHTPPSQTLLPARVPRTGHGAGVGSNTTQHKVPPRDVQLCTPGAGRALRSMAALQRFGQSHVHRPTWVAGAMPLGSLACDRRPQEQHVRDRQQRRRACGVRQLRACCQGSRTGRGRHVGW